MKIDFNYVFIQPDGKPFRQPSGEFEKDENGKDTKPILEDLTLKLVATSALNTPTQEDQSMKGDERGRLGSLALTIYQWPVLDVPAAQIALLKERIGRPALGFSNVIIAQVNAVLEGKTMEQVLRQCHKNDDFAKPWVEPEVEVAPPNTAQGG